MYPEFIPIYVGLGILLIMMIVVLVLLISLIRNNTRTPNKPYRKRKSANEPLQHGSTAFCKNCATQFDASQPYCPKCGTPR